MKIGGFQKFSLLDYPGELSAIVFTQGCNFRCPYCHNPELVLPELYGPLLNTEKVLRFLYRRRKKLSAVVVTGGEPTLQEDLLPFLKILKAMRYKVKLDTNGASPDVLAQVIYSKAVDYIAMDIKAPLPLYKKLTRSKVKKEDIVRSMELIRLSGLAYEFRTTVAPEILFGDDLYDIHQLLSEGDRYYIQPCQYSTTLDDLKKHELTDTDLKKSGEYLRLQDWAEKHRVRLEFRM
ncbi:MAG: anaerobic ribonucleoside-triphosphate reductase activating protein [Candidatus Cloacimonadaceae bacterium]|jgi:pyruvate formate lyase activating enzyme|nr:anaerobic ribonucleoside-triphosphate reductase activating protein [Candidatus Cloacimonadota bacterium]MDY0127470.1 anaerobic ribonucleoside-triphosphate reductase activating protein [Candidatus Cloacimonadaceae bacterium]MCB5254826.1 anaerobic ribonucleoside-triphosphate reductase activating protein [Candidatus Cloacimonadota bacterium]MCK9178915.1 anaerobic ribonucleoside-triphosphate reductase activating protein [Candidatus Cloacimonadota bacterium]MCK9243608.1 anaerobic ribonucleoside-t